MRVKPFKMIEIYLKAVVAMRNTNPLIGAISTWFRRNFSDPAAVALFFTVLFLFLFLEFFGNFFMPVLISIVLAYLLASVVRFAQKLRCPHTLSVVIVFLLFIGLVVLALVGLLPIIIHQLENLVNEIPNIFTQAQTWVTGLIQNHPKIFSDQQLQHVVSFFQSESARIGQFILQMMFSLIPNMVTVVLYFILVPLLLFFFLKDTRQITHWLAQYLPRNRSLVHSVWEDINQKIGCYVRGRVIEIIIISTITSLTFAILGMQYAILLGVLVGLSVIIPYIGVVVVTIPVLIVGLMQWGFAPHLLYMLIAYAVIIVFDANFLVPWLFAEVMDLHPIVIILSVLVFGGIWGFWGVFFAIPLATVVDVLLRSWPRVQESE